MCRGEEAAGVLRFRNTPSPVAGRRGGRERGAGGLGGSGRGRSLAGASDPHRLR